jgi:hypothetical protein
MDWVDRMNEAMGYIEEHILASRDNGQKRVP